MKSCTCPEHSPFRWHKNPKSTLIDASMRAVGKAALTSSQRSSLMVEEMRAAGKNSSHVADVSRKLEATRTREFNVYAKAGRDKVLFERKTTRKKGSQ